METTKKASPANYYVRIIGTLFAIAAIVAVLLALVNVLTKETIQKNKDEKTARAMSEVMPGVATPTDEDKLALPESFENAKDIKEVLLAKNADGDVLGYCVTTSTNGNDGAIELMVGVDADGAVTKVSIISQKETMYTNKHGELIARFDGKSGEVKLTNDGGEISAISGATITSRAVTKGVNSALAAVNAIMEGGAE